MFRLILMAPALMLIGCGSITPQPLAFPQAPSDLTEPCARPQALARASAAEALKTVTGNYARHHACADRHKALADWLKEQRGAIE